MLLPVFDTEQDVSDKVLPVLRGLQSVEDLWGDGQTQTHHLQGVPGQVNVICFQTLEACAQLRK